MQGETNVLHAEVKYQRSDIHSMTRNLAYHLQQAIRVERRHETQQRKQKFVVDGHVASQVRNLSV